MLEVPEVDGVYKLLIKVATSDIDEQGHVNNVVYLKWVLHIASEHWNKIASAAMKSQWKWVVLRHEIDYHGPAFAGDLLEASTWVAPPEGPRQKRFVSIKREADQKVLISATTTWCLLESVSRKPRRITEEIASLFGLKHRA